MSVAVANRPVEQFQTQVPLPDWQLSPEEELDANQAAEMNDIGPMVDENGMPLGTPPQQPGYPVQQPMVGPNGEPTQQELDQAFPPQQQQPVRRLPPPQPQPRAVYPPPQPPQPEPHSASQSNPS